VRFRENPRENITCETKVTVRVSRSRLSDPSHSSRVIVSVSGHILFLHGKDSCVCARVWVCRLNQVHVYLIDRRELGGRGIFFLFFFLCSCKLVLVLESNTDGVDRDTNAKIVDDGDDNYTCRDDDEGGLLGRSVRMERMIEEAAACYVSVLRRLQHDSGVCSTLARE
jgi:hypothetical protein